MVFDDPERADGNLQRSSNVSCELAEGCKRPVLFDNQHAQERLHFYRAHVAQIPRDTAQRHYGRVTP